MHPKPDVSANSPSGGDVAQPQPRTPRRAGGRARVAQLSLLLLSLVAAIGLGLPRTVSAETIEGVDFPPAIDVEGVSFKLNAVGLLRYMVFIKAYVAGLYLGPGVSPKQILSDTPRRLEIEYFYPIDEADFERSTTESIEKNVDAETFSAIQPQIEAFNDLYRSVEPGDRYALTYVPGVGTQLELNGEVLGTVPGVEFGSAVFSIWFGPAEIDSSLKEALLKTPS